MYSYMKKIKIKIHTYIYNSNKISYNYGDFWYIHKNVDQTAPKITVCLSYTSK